MVLETNFLCAYKMPTAPASSRGSRACENRSACPPLRPHPLSSLLPLTHALVCPTALAYALTLAQLAPLCLLCPIQV